MEINLDTAGSTSLHEVAETENGYYALFWGRLYYADKSDLTNWVIVCNQPTCLHNSNTCPAYIGSWLFYLEDGRLYMPRPSDGPNGQAETGMAIYTMAADGTDLESVYPLDELLPHGTAWGYVPLAAPAELLLCTSFLQPDGNFQYSLSVLEKDGLHILSQTALEDENTELLQMDPSFAYGDFVFRSTLLDSLEGRSRAWYRLAEDGACEAVPALDQYHLEGSFLSGDHLYHFVTNDGYYYTDLSTGASVKWMDAQLADSAAYQFGSDFILETNLYTSPTPEPQMQLFDGAQWRTIALPDGFWPEGEEGEYGMQVLALTTCHLLLKVNHMKSSLGSTLYAVDLTADNLEAVYCAEFGT